MPLYSASIASDPRFSPRSHAGLQSVQNVRYLSMSHLVATAGIEVSTLKVTTNWSPSP